MTFEGLGLEAVFISRVGAIQLANFIQQRLVCRGDGCRAKVIHDLVGLFDGDTETIQYLPLQRDAISVQVRR